LVVHGIGEQERFATAAALARSLAGTLGARDKAPRFSLIDRTSQQTVDQLACPSADPSDSPYEIVVADAAGAKTHIHIHEVWWADLGVSDTFSSQFQFWVWALGQWGARIDRVTHFARGSSNTNLLMVGPKFQEQDSTESFAPDRSIFRARFLLFLWGVAAFLTFFSWNVVKQVLSWISPYIGSSSLITDYVGHVRIYTQSQPVGGGSLEDVGQPWRATIRRRMIAELVAMAERGYDRWYLLAHSQGSVLAFNAIQETEWCLPNHLQLAQAERLRQTPLWTHAPFVPALSEKPSLERMMPRRPVWLTPDDGISREHLFERFRGLLTYGSPLDKFATLWPRIVSLNKQRNVFPVGADWVNLWDVADPIGACLSAFSDPVTAWPDKGPTNIYVRANPLFLYSHICYLRPEKADAQRDTNAILEEVLPVSSVPGGLQQAFMSIPDGGKLDSLRRNFARVQALLLMTALALGAGLLAYMAKGLVVELLKSLPTWASRPFESVATYLTTASYGDAVELVIYLAIAIVLGCGLYRGARERWASSAPTPGSAAPRLA
jgi:hypothetical protein